jgi:DnaJ-domain-containing protein 1
MFQNSGLKKTRNKFAVEVQLDDGKIEILFIFVTPGNRVIDVLNDERDFIPFETASGKIMIYQKTAIRSINPLFAADKISSRDPYDILDVSHKASDEEIHQAYRRAVAAVHPDHVQSLGLPEEFLELATKRSAAINDAFDKIKRERGEAPGAAVVQGPHS